MPATFRVCMRVAGADINCQVAFDNSRTILFAMESDLKVV